MDLWCSVALFSSCNMFILLSSSHLVRLTSISLHWFLVSFNLLVAISVFRYNSIIRPSISHASQQRLPLLPTHLHTKAFGVCQSLAQTVPSIQNRLQMRSEHLRFGFLMILTSLHHPALPLSDTSGESLSERVASGGGIHA